MSAFDFSLSWTVPLAFLLSFLSTAFCLTGYDYVLDTEYSGANFFNGWNFFTVSASQSVG
jgi:hypothetical protein